jgi:hypothetical protein
MERATTELLAALRGHAALRDARTKLSGDAIELERDGARARLIPAAEVARQAGALRAWLVGPHGLLVIGALAGPELDALAGDAPIALLPEGSPTAAIALALHGLLERVAWPEAIRRHRDL